MRPLRNGPRRALGTVAAGTALGVAFAAGVLLGAGGRASGTVSEGVADGVLDEAAAEIAAAALTPVDRSRLDAAAVQAMLAAAGDPWGAWASDAAAESGQAGVGLWLRPAASGALFVARVRAGSPAARAGVRVADELRAVGDTSVRGLAPARAAALLRGPTGSRVRVLLARGATLRTVGLRRVALRPAAVVATAERSGAGAHVLRLAVPAFDRGVGRQVRSALARRSGEAPARGVLLDLRGNGGGRLDEAVEVASSFLDGGPVVAYARRDAPAERLDAVGTGDAATPLVVLVDGGTASAAEAVAAALQERGRAVLVGSRTYGKGSVQEPRRLPDGSALDLTVARWTTPSGRSVEGAGLLPDIEVAPAAAPAVAVRRGVEVLTGLRAGAGGRG